MYTEVDSINLAIKKGFVESLSGFITVAVKDQAEESPPQLSMRISFAEILVLDISKGTRYLCLEVVIREPLKLSALGTAYLLYSYINPL